MSDNLAGQLIIREATLADLPKILAMLSRETLPIGRETDPSDPCYRRAFDEITASPNELLVAAELYGRVVGTLQISFLPGLSYRGRWRGQIEAVRIAEDVRNRGLGAQLIDWAVERCRERGCFMVQLTSNLARADAHRFYERLGWSKSHAGFKLKLEN